MLATPEAPPNSLPPSVDDWLSRFFPPSPAGRWGRRATGGPGRQPSERVIRVLYHALTEGEQPSIKELSRRAGVGPATAHRVIQRMKQLRLIEVSMRPWNPPKGLRGVQPYLEVSYRPLPFYRSPS